MTPLLQILRLWRSETPALLAGLLTVLLSTAALAALALTAGAAPLAAGALLLLLLRALGISRVLLRYIERLVTHGATFRALTTLRLWLFRRLIDHSAGGLGFLRRGDALARLVGDVDALDGLYLRILVPLAATTLLLASVAFVLASSSPTLAAAVCLLLAAAALLIPFAAARATRASGSQLAGAAANLRVAAVDAFTGIREIRAFGQEGRTLATVQAREAALFEAQRSVARKAALAGAAAILSGQAALLLVVWAGLPAPALLPAVLLTVAALEASAAMPRAGALAGHAAAAAARVLEAGQPATPPIPDPPAPLTLPPPGRPIPDPPAPLTMPPPGRTSLRFENIRFAWPGRAPLFEELTLEIPAGSRVAILGPSGAGKSTLAALALKVVAPQSGRILLGGTDLARLNTAELRAEIAWLSQSTHVFSDTIRANLLLGRPDADEPAQWRALAQAGLAETVQTLPNGLDTWVGEGGAGLSGGQLRRLALARALLSTAPILILDEPATGLDDAAERAFFTTLNDAAPGRTVILIVHRLLGVEQLDRIWRLSGGHAIAAAG